jgi:Transglutaminase-like superfamily
LNITVIEPDSERVEVNLQPGRLEIRTDAQVVPREFVVVVRIEMNASTRSSVVDPARLEPWDRTDPEYQLYTQPREGLIQVTDQVARLAADLTARAKHAGDVVRAFWIFFLERMSSGKIHHDELSRTDPLGSLLSGGWFDCLTGSSLFAALCRARGIPARVVNGFTLYPIIPSNHYWAEVLLPPFGWVPFDLASWDLAGGLDRSSSWEESYFGQVDPRMIFQRFPRQILGPPGVRFPASWYLLPAVRDHGLETSYFALDTGELLYRDWIRVRRVDDHSGQNSSVVQSRVRRTARDALDLRGEISADVCP